MNRGLILCRRQFRSGSVSEHFTRQCFSTNKWDRTTVLAFFPVHFHNHALSILKVRSAITLTFVWKSLKQLMFWQKEKCWFGKRVIPTRVRVFQMKYSVIPRTHNYYMSVCRRHLAALLQGCLCAVSGQQCERVRDRWGAASAILILMMKSVE